MRATLMPARSIFLLLTLLMLFSGCVGTRYLKDDEYLLYDQEIKGANKISSDDLGEFYRQQPNKRFPVIPFAPYVWLYQVGLKHYDKDELKEEKVALAQKYDKKIAAAQGKKNRVKKLSEKKDKKISKIDRSLEEGNLLMRWGEPLAIYDSSLANTTRDQMLSYLNTKGFFNGTVSHDIKLNGKRVTSIYTVVENQPYNIDTITYSTDDSTIARLIKTSEEESNIEKGQVYDQEKLGAERDRIDNLLKNNGYFDFSRQYVTYKVDSTVGDHAVSINLIVNEPADRNYHKQYRLDSVVFTTDADLRGLGGKRQTSTFNNITYRYYRYEYYKKILDRRIFIYPDSLYSRDETLQTQRQLSNLDIFKFININYDTAGGHFVARVYASPLKKYQTANEVGLTVSQGYPGPFANSSLKIRNIFGGLEILELSGQAGIEGVPSATSVQTKGYRSIDISGNLGLTFPQFIFPLPDRLKSRYGSLNPKTVVQTGYNYINRPEYIRTNFKSSLSYSWQKEQRSMFNFTPIDINFINSNIKSDEFRAILQAQAAAGIPIIRSFDPSVVTSINFSSIFNFNGYGNYGTPDEGVHSSSYLKLYGESGGTIFNIINPSFLENIGKGLQYFKYIKFNPDFRQYLPLSKSSTLAYRFNVGIAIPYGGGSAGNVLPYEKYFFAGGSNSIRAWKPRRLGPGALAPTKKDSTDSYYIYDLEQPGEILLESSVEFRRNLFSFINGAFFIDAGNVWRIVDTGNKDAIFKLNKFYTQIAVGSGLGLRFDFSFLILRFDYGVKIYDPARDPYDPETHKGGRWIGQQFSVGQEINHGVLNIGIGYPF